MSKTMFYSWQSDLPNRHNRGFISDVLQRVIKEAKSSEEYQIDLNLDRDTNGESGSPDIANTIFDKIKHSEIFVCDVSLINKDSVGRPTPNPNVLIELGYSASSLGWDNVICLFNEAYGDLKQLPFDIQQRRIISYYLDDESNKPEVRKKLIRVLLGAIDSAGVEYLKRKRRVLAAFNGVEKEAINIALHRPDYWEFKLSEVLFESVLDKVESRIDDIDNGIHFIAKRHLNDRDLFDWLRVKIEDLNSIFTALKLIMETKWHVALGEPGKSGDAIAIFDSINILGERLNDCVNWEIDVRSIFAPEQIEDLMKEFSLSFRKMVGEFRTMPKAMKNVYSEDKDKELHQIRLVLELPERMVEVNNQMMAYFRNVLMN